MLQRIYAQDCEKSCGRMDENCVEKRFVVHNSWNRNLTVEQINNISGYTIQFDLIAYLICFMNRSYL